MPSWLIYVLGFFIWVWSGSFIVAVLASLFMWFIGLSISAANESEDTEFDGSSIEAELKKLAGLAQEDVAQREAKRQVERTYQKTMDGLFADDDEQDNEELDLHEILLEVLLPVMRLVMRADGTSRRVELKAIEFFFRQLGITSTEVQYYLKEQEENSQAQLDLVALSWQLQQLHMHERALVMEGLYRVAYADGVLAPEEEEILRQVGAGLDLHDLWHVVQSLAGRSEVRQGYQRRGRLEFTRAEACICLGLLPDSNNSDAHQRYRALKQFYDSVELPTLGTKGVELCRQALQELEQAIVTIEKVRKQKKAVSSSDRQVPSPPKAIPAPVKAAIPVAAPPVVAPPVVAPPVVAPPVVAPPAVAIAVHNPADDNTTHAEEPTAVAVAEVRAPEHDVYQTATTQVVAPITIVTNEVSEVNPWLAQLRQESSAREVEQEAFAQLMSGARSVSGHNETEIAEPSKRKKSRKVRAPRKPRVRKVRRSRREREAKRITFSEEALAPLTIKLSDLVGQRNEMPGVLRQLQQPDAKETERTIRGLVALGEDVVPLLVPWLNEYLLREPLFEVLHRLPSGWSQVLDGQMQQLKPLVRTKLLELMAVKEGKVASPHLLQALDESHYLVQQQAAQALTALGWSRQDIENRHHEPQTHA